MKGYKRKRRDERVAEERQGIILKRNGRKKREGTPEEREGERVGKGKAKN